MLQAENRLPEDLQRDSAEYLHAVIEIMRLAWRDRLTLLGDPAANSQSMPILKLLSDTGAQRTASIAAAAVQEKRVLRHNLRANGQSGTIHISAADDSGLMIALTLTHGGSFGAGVTVDGLGLTLGHGMSRFDPNPGHPNCPGPGKRPLHNMTPTIVARRGQSLFAIGGAGGRRIPNTMFGVLRAAVLMNQPLTRALTATRVHTEGTESLLLTPGYAATTGAAAAIATAERPE